NARTRGTGERPRSVPACADHDADGCEFILCLDDGVAVLAARGVSAILAAMAGKSFRQARGRRYRVPGSHCRAAVDAAERRRSVAVYEDALAHRGRTAHAQPDRTLEFCLGVFAPQV